MFLFHSFQSHPGGLLFTKFGSNQTALLDLAFPVMLMHLLQILWFCLCIFVSCWNLWLVVLNWSFYLKIMGWCSFAILSVDCSWFQDSFGRLHERGKEVPKATKLLTKLFPNKVTIHLPQVCIVDSLGQIFFSLFISWVFS